MIKYIFALVYIISSLALAEEHPRNNELVYNKKFTIAEFEKIILAPYPTSVACEKVLIDNSMAYQGSKVKGNKTGGKFQIVGSNDFIYYDDSGKETKEDTDTNVIDVQMNYQVTGEISDPYGRLKIWKDKYGRMIKVQELVHSDSQTIAVKQFEFGYDSDHFCIPKRLATFNITPASVSKADVKFRFNKCLANRKIKGCDEPGVAVALDHVRIDNLLKLLPAGLEGEEIYFPNKTLYNLSIFGKHSIEERKRTGLPPLTNQ
jgi:hypothetical protein